MSTTGRPPDRPRPKNLTGGVAGAIRSPDLDSADCISERAALHHCAGHTSRCAHPRRWCGQVPVQILAAILPGSTGLLPDKIQALAPAAWDAFNIQDEDDAMVRVRCLDVAGPDLVDDFFVIADASWKKSAGPFSIKACELTTLMA